MISQTIILIVEDAPLLLTAIWHTLTLATSPATQILTGSDSEEGLRQALEA